MACCALLFTESLASPLTPVHCRARLGSHTSNMANPNANLLQLPMELQDLIESYLRPEAYITYAFALYPQLFAQGRVPRISLQTLHYIVGPPPPASGWFSMLPAEMVLDILRPMNRRDQVATALADYHDFRRLNIAPTITSTIRYGLIGACLRGANHPT